MSFMPNLDASNTPQKIHYDLVKLRMELTSISSKDLENSHDTRHSTLKFDPSGSTWLRELLTLRNLL